MKSTKATDEKKQLISKDDRKTTNLSKISGEMDYVELKEMPEADANSSSQKNTLFMAPGDSNDIYAPNSSKKKQPPFLLREIKVKNVEQIDQRALLNSLKDRFESNYKTWSKRAKRLRLANFFVIISIISIQVLQVILMQLEEIKAEDKHAIATILPSITSAILAVQLKLSWAQKATKGKRSAALYQKLVNHVEYRLSMLDCGGEFDGIDGAKMMNTAFLSEITEVPAFLLLY